MAAILAVVGKSGAGKTTLIEKLIPEIQSHGYRVAVVKHHAHPTPIDTPGKDSWRFAQAGAGVVVVASPAEMARYERLESELTLAEIAARLPEVDLILAEGYKRENVARIEVSRAAQATELLSRADEVLAVVSDHATGLQVPHFGLDDAPGLAAFIIARLLPAREKS